MFSESKNYDAALKLALQSGYDDVDYVEDCEGYAIYHPFCLDDIGALIGMPDYIIVKEGKAEWKEYYETIEWVKKQEK